MTLVMCCSTKLYEGKLAAINAIKDALQKENDQLRDAVAAGGGEGGGAAGGGGGSNDDREAREMLGEWLRGRICVQQPIPHNAES